MERGEFKFKYSIQILQQQEQFWQWVRQLFFLNDSLNKEYNFLYCKLLYVNLSELFTEGERYAVEVARILKKGHNKIKYRIYTRLNTAISDIKSAFTDEEYRYIEYRRHNACHIFQDGYEEIKQNGEVKVNKRHLSDRSGNKYEMRISDISKDNQFILGKYVSDQGFDEHLISIIYPILNQLFIDLNELREQELEMYG